MEASLDFLEGGGEATRLIRARDWSGHPMGPPERWPEAFRAALSLVLNSPESMILAWGPDLSFFFNESYMPLLGPRTPWAMGARFDQVWAEAMEQARPIIDDAMAGRSRRFDDLPWKLATDRGAAETWWSFSYSRVLGADGRPAGLFIFTNETTGRVLSEAARRDEEARNRQVLDSAVDYAVVATDLEGRITRWNEGARRILGWSEAEMLGQSAARFFTPEDREAGVVAREMRGALQAGRAADRRWHLRASGERFWADGEMTPLRDAGGAAVGFVKVLKDQTTEHAASVALKASEARLSRAQQAGGVGVFSVELAEGKLYGSPEFCRIFGLDPCDGFDVAELQAKVHPDDVALTSVVELPSRGEVTPRVEYRIRRGPAGEERVIARRAEVERDETGAPVRLVGVVQDVTDRHAAQRELEESEARSRDAAEALRRLNEELEARVAARTQERDRVWRLSRDLFLVIGRDGLCKAANPTWERELGYPPQVLEGRAYDRLVHADDRPSLHGGFAALADGADAVEAECRVRSADGAWRDTVWTAVAADVGFVCTGRDVTEQRRTEEALRQAQKMEAVGQLTGGLAHDFNNLLAGISGALELMGSRIAQGRTGELVRYIDVAQGAARRAASLTHRLLAFSRRQTLAPRPTDVNALVLGMEELVRRTVGPAVRVEVVGASGLWPTLVDPPQLENALLNLCINARDAMSGDGRLTIETANKWLDDHAARTHDLPAGQYVSLCVTDTGAGMTPEVAAKAFDPFFTTKPIGEGTGLGLSMIYGFAKQSGGQVRIYSEVGQGTTVCVYLPRHLGEVPAVDPFAGLAAPPRGEVGETVLVVDDEPTVRLLVTEVLEDLGYTALEAADSQGGLRVLQSNARIDLLVTDVGLPGGMNGRQMADAGRAGRPDLKVLFITGYAENAVLNGGRLDPGMAVLTKPFVIEVLAARIREMIAKDGAGQG